MTPSLPPPLERRDPETSHQKKTGEGDPAPQQARRRRAPVDAAGRRRGTQALQAESPPPTFHTSKRTQTKQPLKITLDTKTRASKDHQPRTRSSTTSSTPPHHTSRETPPTKPRHQSKPKQTWYPPQHAWSALKNMSVERGKAGVPCEVHSTKRTPPRTRQSPNPVHTHQARQQTLHNHERRASRPLRRKTPPLAPPRRPLHIIQVERPANRAAPPKREADAV